MDPFRMDPFTYAEYMKVQGNQDFKNGFYSMAIKKYDEAIGALAYLCQMGSDSRRDMAVVLCNRSNAFYNLNKWDEALQSARESLQFDGTYIKGYYRAGYSLIKLSRTLDAARTFQQGLSILLYPSFRIPESSALISDFLVGIFSTVNNERVITPQFLLICKNAVSGNFSPAIWQQVVEKLAKKGQWQSCLLLSTEKDRLPRSLRVNNLSLKDLFEKYVLFGNYERMERVPKLVEWLISIGASIRSVGTCPLHAVIKLCIKAKGNRLFRWLLDHAPELKDLINQQNEDGSTVLHIVASQISGYSWKNQIDDLMMLLKAGVDPGICDAQLRTAVDIFKKNKKFRAVEAINKHIAKSMPRSEESQVTVETESGAEETESGASDVLNTVLLQEAFEKFVSFCHLENEAHNTNLLKNGKTQRLVKLLSRVRDIPDEITCDIPPACARNFIKLLLEKQLWHQVLLLLTRTTTGQTIPGNALIKSCDLSDLDIAVVLQCIDKSTKQRVQLLKCLIDRGASPEGIGTAHEKPLQKCLKNNDFEMAHFLLRSGADPHCISFVEGDTPLHAAVSICFDKYDDIGLCFLSSLLNLYVSNPSAFPYLNPNIQNKNGDTILHIIFQKNLTKQVKKMLSLLAKFDINCNLKNNSGRDVFYKRKKNDPVRIAWNEAVGENKKKFRHDGLCHLAKMPKPPPNGDKSQSRNSTKLSSAPSSTVQSGKQPADVEAKGCESSWDEEERAGVKNSEFNFNKSTVREYLVQEIAQLIQKLALSEVSPRINSVTQQNVKSSSFEAKVEDEKCIQQPICDGACLVYNGGKNACLPKEKVFDEYQGSDDPGEEPVEEDEQLQETEAYTQDFDNMTWEIECTSEMLKKLGSKSIPSKMKKRIVFVVQQLGNGEWTQSLQKPLKHSESNIQLYEAKLNKGGRMLWEIAIEFSPRCSENAEKIIEDEHSTHPANKTGRVYTEIIRIWDIVLDHKKLDHAIENICTSYNRGLSCILRKKLKGINLAPMSSNLKTQKRFPRIYVEDTRVEKPKDYVTPEYFPPASALETEYNIMKFHSFSTNMALNIISDMTSAVEYPFRVGELEYAVIDLNPKPLEPIILIGRSGTGKTTCCLYRLWKKFLSYWERAEMAQGPLLVRQMWRTLKFEMQLENKRKEPTAEKLDCSDSVDSGELETSVSTDDEQGQLEDEQYDSSSEDPETTAVNECEETEESTAEDCDKLEHLHQIFVTKNHVLCQEVQKNFIELSKSSKPTSHFKPLEANIYRLQDVKDENFPLFLTSQQLLLLLDASMPEPFFLRNEDGSLKRTIAGWSTKEDLVISNWDEEEDDVDVEVDCDEEEKVEEVQEKECDPRTFVTFSIFANKFWPQMIKGKCPYNPALVWKEIKSFLKGSFEALNSHQGILTEEEYKKLGRKRSPNFKEDRSEIYQLFIRYQQIRSQGYFDEEDVLYKLSQRLSKLNDLPWSIHELYGDEIQDFTQAELVLLMKCIDNPNAMFLTGDTAQSIMKGVAFRFSDLKSLFHYASKSSTDKKQCIVRKPKRIYQLYQNYRSHSGILRLASGVVDLLQYYFPESFDRLPRDSGLFDGPKPTVLESCSVSDLAILLKGNKRKTQPIEFGAHQVILVANEMAKEKIPEELSLALVLTIYEAKGLEFDDVLLYNFFTDSEAYKEWKIISSFVPPSHFPDETKLIIEAPLEKDLDSQGKVLNPEMYKMLNGELKHLYTAITRARVNLWIFDENEDKRAPAFQYFVKQKLVQVVKKDEDFDDSMFVKTSTPHEWIAQGEYYAKHQCWKVAAKCYQKGGAIKKEKLALAHDAVLKVHTKKISPKEKQKEYMDLAKTYLEYGEPNLALKCLMKVKEYRLCAQLCEKLGKVKEAAYLYKRSHCFKDAYRCFEQIQEFDLALKMCYQEECFEEGAKAVERYEKILRKDGQLTSKLSYTASQFYLEAAAKYRRTGKISQMMEMLSHLDTEDQLVFLKTHRYFHEAADLLKRDGRNEEAAKLMKQHGFVLEAAKLTNQKDFRASCLLAVARLHSASLDKLENGRAILKEAIELYEETNQKSGGAEATYLMGILEKDFNFLKRAFCMFLEVNHNAGAVEALFQAIRCEEESETILNITSDGIEALLNLVKAFKKTYSNAQREMVKSCFEYFGIVLIDKETCQISQNEAGCILEFGNSSAKEKKTSDQFTVGLEEVKFTLNKHLLNRLNDITFHLHQLSFPNICLKFMAGLKCEEEACGDFHEVLSRHKIKSIFHCKMHLAAINGLLLEAKQLFPKDLLHESDAIDDMLTADKYALCKSLIDVLFPKHFHLRMVSNNPVAFKQIMYCSHRTFKLCRIVLREYIRSQFNNETARNRRESTDLWLRTMQVFAWTRSYPEEFERLVYTEEDEFDRDRKLLVGRSKGIEGKYGMLIPDKYSENLESTHLCFIRLLQYSLDLLYVHRNLEECKFLFFRFLNVLVKRCVDPLIPSIGNTVALLEFQFILYCTVLMRLCKNMTLCLPKSYIALLQYWEFLFRRKDQYGDVTFSIIQEYRPEDARRAINKFKFHLKYLASVLCGYEQFNVLLDAFGDPDFIVSGEAERTVVLCLVMLVNADQVLSYKYKEILTVRFPKIREILLRMKKECPSKVPERLFKIVNLMSEASDIKTVVTGLKELLFCRDEEYLADCCWRWSYRDGNNKGVRGIYYQDADLDRFVYLNQAEYFEDPDIDFENDINIEERKDPLANIASIRLQKQQQKAFAKRKLECLFLFVCFWVRWKKMSCSKSEPAEAALGIFKRADVDPTQCDLCGVKFLQRSETYIAQVEDSEKDPMESTDTDWEENVETNENENAATVITYDSHVILDEHKKKYSSYLKYYDFFRTKVEPIIHRGKNMIENIAESFLIKGHFASKEQFNLLRRKIQDAIKKISDTVEDIYKRKAWADAEEILLKLASKLSSHLDDTSTWLKNTESHLQKEEEFDHDKDLDNNVKGEDVTFDELHHKKPSKRNGRRR